MGCHIGYKNKQGKQLSTLKYVENHQIGNFLIKLYILIFNYKNSLNLLEIYIPIKNETA